MRASPWRHAGSQLPTREAAEAKPESPRDESRAADCNRTMETAACRADGAAPSVVIDERCVEPKLVREESREKEALSHEFFPTEGSRRNLRLPRSQKF
jgi:hypothetical protein